jgi:5-oxopent-3-ene-1,2,5-tricarboxylate decarboxylase/2-hydroxyhepta-2,4-diene-1,7-dioate isomerase
LKLFSFSYKEQDTAIGVTTSKGSFNLSKAFDIFQKAKGSRIPFAVDFLQVLIELGYCRSVLIEDILAQPWVQSKSERIRLVDNFHYNLPITRPSKIIGLGRNYKAHAKELNHEIPSEPLFFCKAPSALIPHETAIHIPPWLDSRVDHEAELALIIGKKAKNVQEEQAMDFVAGYTILNDVSARDIQKEDLSHNKPWFRSKSIDTFCPLGPFVVPADSIKDPHDLEIRLTVNGKEKQIASTKSMIFKIPYVVSYLSRFMTLEPGDIIATGTPEGVSPIKENDIIEITITGLGTLRNTVVKE